MNTIQTRSIFYTYILLGSTDLPRYVAPPPPHMQTTAVVCGVVVLELGTSIIAIVY